VLVLGLLHNLMARIKRTSWLLLLALSFATFEYSYVCCIG
jgi:hypothetical protein